MKKTEKLALALFFLFSVSFAEAVKAAGDETGEEVIVTLQKGGRAEDLKYLSPSGVEKISDRIYKMRVSRSRRESIRLARGVKHIEPNLRIVLTGVPVNYDQPAFGLADYGKVADVVGDRKPELVKTVVMDSGIRPEDLPSETRVDKAASRCFRSDCADPLVDPPADGAFIHGHGTVVAAIITAVAPNTDLVSFRIFTPWIDPSGGRYLVTDVETIVRAFSALKDVPGKKVVNCSFFMPVSPAVRSVLEDLESEVFVAGAEGNDGMRVVVDPCAATTERPNAICIGSHGANLRFSFWSNYGTLDLAAIGEMIEVPLGKKRVYFSGTSAATPLVAGTAVLQFGVNPEATPKQVKEALVRGGIVTPWLSPFVPSAKRLNIPGAIEALGSTLKGEDTLLVSVQGVSSVWENQATPEELEPKEKTDTDIIEAPIPENEKKIFAPNQIVEIVGNNFCDHMEVPPDGSFLPTELCGVSVILNHLPIPLMLVSQTSIRVLIPQDPFVLWGENRWGIVKRNSDGVVFDGAMLPDFSRGPHPDVFLQDGKSYPYLEKDGGELVSETEPARPGEFLRSYWTGIGPIDPRPKTGQLPEGNEMLLIEALDLRAVWQDGTTVPAIWRLSPSSQFHGLFVLDFSVPNLGPQNGTVSIKLVVDKAEKIFSFPYSGSIALPSFRTVR